ncbi:MAG: transcriptional repressor [Bacteriovoracaceae bacterium]|nr:transcriptional repressor [Bacteriovoracaceae bacterium]
MNIEEAATDRLKEKGLRCTKARLIILSHFLKQNKPLSIKEFKKVKELKELDESSLYRNFKKLEKAKLIHSVPGSDDFQYYEIKNPQTHDHHHHITCNSCKKIQCLNDCSVERQLSKMAESAGFKIEGHKLELYGTCLKCLSKKL